MSFSDAVLIGDNITPERYLLQPIREDGSPVRKGDPEYIMGAGNICDQAACQKKWLKSVDQPSDSKDWGSLVDCLTLTPHQFETRYAVTPEMYPCEPTTKDPRTEKPWHASKYCDAWEAEQESNGKVIVKRKDVAPAKSAVEELLADENIRTLLERSRKQVMVTAIYTDRQTSLKIPVRVLYDVVGDGGFFETPPLADLKALKSAALEPWPRILDYYNWDAQAWLYRAIWKALTGEDRKSFLHILSENSEPFTTGRRIVSDTQFTMGETKIMTGLQKYCRAIATGKWGGYDSEGGAHNGWTMTEPSIHQTQRCTLRCYGEIKELPPFEESETEEEAVSDLIP